METMEKVAIAGVIGAGLYYFYIRKPTPSTIPVNMITNPGFEELDINGQLLMWKPMQNGSNSIFKLEPDIYGNSITIEYLTNISNSEQAAFTQIIPITEGKSYKFGCKLKTVNIIAASLNGANPYIVWLNSVNALISTSDIVVPLIGTNEWTNVEGIVTAPVGAVSALIDLSLIKATGKVWFDDVFLYEQ